MINRLKKDHRNWNFHIKLRRNLQDSWNIFFPPRLQLLCWWWAVGKCKYICINGKLSKLTTSTMKVLKLKLQVSTVSDQTFPYIQILCQDTMDPDRSSKLVQDLLNSNIKRMIRLGIGTNDVESMFSSLQKPLARKTEDRQIISTAMRLLSSTDLPWLMMKV